MDPGMIFKIFFFFSLFYLIFPNQEFWSTGIKQPQILYKWLWNDLCPPSMSTFILNLYFNFSLNIICYLWRKDHWPQVQRGHKTRLFFLHWNYHYFGADTKGEKWFTQILGLWGSCGEGGSRHEFMAGLLICSIKKKIHKLFIFILQLWPDVMQKKKAEVLFHVPWDVQGHPKSSPEQPHVFDPKKNPWIPTGINFQGDYINNWVLLPHVPA